MAVVEGGNLVRAAEFRVPSPSRPVVLVVVEEECRRMRDLVTDCFQQQIALDVPRQEERAEFPPRPQADRARHGEDVGAVHDVDAGKGRQRVAVDGVVDAVVFMAEGVDCGARGRVGQRPPQALPCIPVFVWGEALMPRLAMAP